MEVNKVDPKTAHEKLDHLRGYLKNLGSVAIAFSSGVDSTFLLKVAHDTLGERCAAITVRSRVFPERESREAADFCLKEGIRHIVLESDELKIEGFRENPANRCYICKKALFTGMLSAAHDAGFKYLAEGSNMDDLGDYRPGLQAIAELHIESPLRSAGLTKAEIRYLSREMELPTWSKPSYACLASRFVYGEEITAEKLMMVDKAEQLLHDMGLGQYRVRIHGNIARIEVLPEEFSVIIEDKNRQRICSELRAYGFAYVTLDLMGYRTGSMNEVLRK